jgi:hypothetical protein
LIGHSVRPHLFSGAQTFSLEADSLALEDGGTARRVPYADIGSIRLIAYAGYDGQQKQCAI